MAKSLSCSDAGADCGWSATAETEEELGRVHALENEILSKVIEWGGSISGEHGIGHHRRRFMKSEHGESLELMRAIKQLFDPNNILCPSTIFPE